MRIEVAKQTATVHCPDCGSHELLPATADTIRCERCSGTWSINDLDLHVNDLDYRQLADEPRPEQP